MGSIPIVGVPLPEEDVNTPPATAEVLADIIVTLLGRRLKSISQRSQQTGRGPFFIRLSDPDFEFQQTKPYQSAV